MNVKRVVPVFLSMFFIVLGAACAVQADEHIRVGSFNIADFGATDEYERSLIGLVNIIRKMEADLICLQKVEPSDLGEDQVERLVKLLNRAAQHFGEEQYDHAISEKSGDEARRWDRRLRQRSELPLGDQDFAVSDEAPLGPSADLDPAPDGSG